MTAIVGHPYAADTSSYVYSPWVIGGAIVKDADGLIGQANPFPLSGRQLMAMQWKARSWRVQCALFGMDETVELFTTGTPHPARLLTGEAYWTLDADDPRYPGGGYVLMIGNLLFTFYSPLIDAAIADTSPASLADAVAYVASLRLDVTLASNEEDETYPGTPASLVTAGLSGETACGTLTVTGFADAALNWDLPILRGTGDPAHTYPTLDITVTATEWNWPDFT
jgi:hypothetical protein